MLFVLLSFGIWHQALAAEKDPLACIRLLVKEASNSLYDPQYCQRNVWNLIQHIQTYAPAFDLKQANVYYITRPINDEVPSFGTSMGPTLWTHHVILEASDQIIDLDVLGDTKIMDKASYIKAMFLYPDLESRRIYSYLGGISDAPDAILKDLHITVIPADYYLKVFSDKGVGKSGTAFFTSKPAPYYKGSMVDYLQLNPDALVASIPHQISRQVGDTILKAMAPCTFLKISGEPTYIKWTAWNIDFMIDYKKGRISLLKDKKEIRDPEKVDYFLRKVYLDSQAEGPLKQAVIEGKRHLQSKKKNLIFF